MNGIVLTAGADSPRNLGLVPLDANKDPPASHRDRQTGAQQ